MKKNFKKGRPLLPQRYKLRRTLSVKLTDNEYANLERIKEASDGEFKCFADVLRAGVNIIYYKMFGKRESLINTLT